SNSLLHSAQDDQPITKLSNTVKDDYKFGMETPDTIIKEQRMSLVKSRRGKGFMCYGDQAVNVPKKDIVPSKTRSLTIAEETVVRELSNSINMYAEWIQKLKGHIVEDPEVQPLLDLRKGSKASRLKSLKQKKKTVIG
ncbi:hypothetical protein Tco_1496705, partial [Tanacetum coccineum]